MLKVIITAVSENGCIGRAGEMPWHCSVDMRWFKQWTWDSWLIMGYNTFKSVGVLPHRYTAVLTKNHQEDPDLKGFAYLDMDHALKAAEDKGVERIFFTGGAEIYKESLKIADEIILTRIPGNYDGDTFFPEWPLDHTKWKLRDKYMLLDYGKWPPPVFSIYQRRT